MTPANRQIDAQLRYGKRLHGAGRLAEAGLVYQQVLAVAPAHPDALDMMGVLLLQSARPAEALPWIERAIAIKPGACAFHVHHAHLLLALGRAGEAAAAARAALKLKRGDAEAYQALGHALIDSGDRDGALKAYHDAARLKPDLPDIQNNIGTALHQTGRLDDALRTLTRAAAARTPADPGVLVNLSTVLRDLGRFADAEAKLAAAARLAPDDPSTLYNTGLLRLLLGRLAEGWPGWEQRFAAGAVPDRVSGKPRWRGEPLAGRTLLIHAEQGLGDTIQFCRFPFPSGGPVVFEVQPRIARLIGMFRPDARIVPAGAPLPPYDLTCPLMSLPAIQGTEPLPSPPAASLPPETVRLWRGRLGEQGFRVGIVWQGNAARREDRGRSIALSHYLPLADIPGVRLISLQKDTGTEQLAKAAKVEALGSDFDSGPDGFIDTAAAMMSLDLVITSDTAAAHLAGTLGRPVWVLLKTVPDWRWMTGREDSPWYPSMRLFRQTTRDDWAPVFAAVKQALEALVHG